MKQPKNEVENQEVAQTAIATAKEVKKERKKKKKLRKNHKKERVFLISLRALKRLFFYNLASPLVVPEAVAAILLL